MPDADLAAEIERLQTLLERQPSCLMRVGVDGTLLAVSDAALNLLGARTVSQLLGTSFVDRLHGDGPEAWLDFVVRVRQSGSSSAECEMDDLAGGRRAVLIQGVALPSHPDGFDSIVVVVRDVSAARRLEESLREQEELRIAAQDDLRAAVEQITSLQAQLDAVAAERQELAVLAQKMAEKTRK